MAESKRLTVLKLLTSHLQGINGIAPYTHDVSEAVFRGRDLFGDGSPVPMLSLLEGKATDYGVYADEYQTIRKDSWLLLLQGWARDDMINPTDPAYELLADVELRISDIVATESGRPKFPGIYMLGGLISSLTVAQPVVRPAEGGLSSKAFFYLPLLVGMKSDITNPRGGRNA